jgi:hypothetical protein
MNNTVPQRLVAQGNKSSCQISDIGEFILFFDWLTELELLKAKPSSNLTSPEAITDLQGLIELPKQLELPNFLNVLKKHNMLNWPKLHRLHELYEQFNTHLKQQFNLQSMTEWDKSCSLSSLLKEYKVGTGLDQDNSHKPISLSDRSDPHNRPNTHKLLELTTLTLRYGNCSEVLTDLKELVNLPNLLKLTLTGCEGLTSLKEISELVAQLSGLTELTLENCRDVNSLVGLKELSDHHPISVRITLKGCSTLVSEAALAVGTENLQTNSTANQPDLIGNQSFQERLEMLKLYLKRKYPEKLLQVPEEASVTHVNLQPPQFLEQAGQKESLTSAVLSQAASSWGPQSSKRSRQEALTSTTSLQGLPGGEERMVFLAETTHCFTDAPIDLSRKKCAPSLRCGFISHR